MNENQEVKKAEQKKIIIFILVFFIMIFGMTILMNHHQEFFDEKSKIDSNNVYQEVVVPENKVENTNEVKEESKVKEVNESDFEEIVLNSDKKVLIDFYADWCGPCKVLSPIVEEVAKENPDIKVVKINVDLNAELSYKYKAYSIPTLVVIENGKEINRAVGAIPKESVLELIK